MSRLRLDRINSQILATVNELLLTKSKDPRLAGLTVTKAVVSGDLRTVRLFYSLIGDEARLADADKALAKANGFVRSSLAATLDRKHTPRLIFERDLNPGHAQRVGQILNQIVPPESVGTDPAEGGDESVPEGPTPEGLGPEAQE